MPAFLHARLRYHLLFSPRFHDLQSRIACCFRSSPFCSASLYSAPLRCTLLRVVVVRDLKGNRGIIDAIGIVNLERSMHHVRSTYGNKSIRKYLATFTCIYTRHSPHPVPLLCRSSLSLPSTFHRLSPTPPSQSSASSAELFFVVCDLCSLYVDVAAPQPHFNIRL